MILDAHTHVGQVWANRPELTADALVAWMDANGVDRAVVLPLESPEAASVPVLTRDVLRATRRHRDRLIPFASIDPRACIRDHDLEPLFAHYMEQGAAGFGEHKVGLAVDDPRSQRLYALAGDLGLPVLLHIDSRHNWDRVGLPGFERMLCAFPHTTFIAHARGWWASISGDCVAADFDCYPSRPVTPGGAVSRLLGRYPNLWADLSAESAVAALSRDPAFAKIFVERHADRLIFGTDYLYPGQPIPQFGLMRALGLSTRARELIQWRNAEGLLAREVIAAPVVAARGGR